MNTIITRVFIVIDSSLSLSLSLSLSPQCDKTTSEAIEKYNWFKISLVSATNEEEINFQWPTNRLHSFKLYRNTSAKSVKENESYFLALYSGP